MLYSKEIAQRMREFLPTKLNLLSGENDRKPKRYTLALTEPPSKTC